MPLVPLASIDDRRLEPYRNLKFTSDMRRAGLFVAEGDKLVRRLLHSSIRVHSVLIGEQFLAVGGLEIPPDVACFVVPDVLLRDVVGFKFHRGILACGFREPEQTLRGVLDRVCQTAAESKYSDKTSNEPRTTIVIGIDIQDPTNLGTMLRTAGAFGVAAFVLGGDCADPFSRRVLRVSMGAPFRLPLVRSDDLDTDLGTLRERFRMTLIAAVASPSGKPLQQLQRPARAAILFGNESLGLSDRWLERCDWRVTIPMDPMADSLNVAVATGIMLYYLCT